MNQREDLLKRKDIEWRTIGTLQTIHPETIEDLTNKTKSTKIEADMSKEEGMTMNKEIWIVRVVDKGQGINHLKEERNPDMTMKGEEFLMTTKGPKPRIEMKENIENRGMKNNEALKNTLDWSDNRTESHQDIMIKDVDILIADKRIHIKEKDNVEEAEVVIKALTSTKVTKEISTSTKTTEDKVLVINETIENAEVLLGENKRVDEETLDLFLLIKRPTTDVIMTGN